MRFAILALALGLGFSADVFAQVNPNKVQVDEYWRKDGTYVPAHERTAPNDREEDNLSYPGNRYSQIIDYSR